jgi:hypothetical protein
MLLLQEAYLYLMLGSAVAVGFVGTRLLRRRRLRALVTGDPIGWAVARPQAHHIRGAVLFGLGWAVACTCPGPAVAQVSMGVAWSVFVFGGIALGVKLRLVQQGRGKTEGRPEGRPSPQQLGASGDLPDGGFGLRVEEVQPRDVGDDLERAPVSG